MIDTTEAGAGSYPTPPEEYTKTVKASVTISFNLNFEVPEDWSDEKIELYVSENYDDFVERTDEMIEEIIIR